MKEEQEKFERQSESNNVTLSNEATEIERLGRVRVEAAAETERVVRVLKEAEARRDALLTQHDNLEFDGRPEEAGEGMADWVEELLAERGKVHGDFGDNARISLATKEVWRKEEGWQRLNAEQREALGMIAAKIARILSGDPNHRDHWIDIAGYATLVVKNRVHGDVR